ncbi:MAG TPA: magnesium transporter CorA family protein [Candidatus Saccharibacteria bacterium]|nr:magnesium transporter CorA family protein [Candidatus Saccharibacteria bacterium]
MIHIYYSTTKTGKIVERDQPVDGSWIHLDTPTDDELNIIAKQYNLDIDLLHDGVDPNESPRIERDGQAVYLFTRYCLPEQEQLTTSPLLMIYVDSVVISVSRRPFTTLEALENHGLFITSKRTQLILQVLSMINKGYKQRVNQASRRIWQIRSQLQKTQIANQDFISFIDIEEDLNDFLLVLEPMAALLHSMTDGKFMRLYEDDKDLIEDLSLGTEELTQLAQSRLTTLRNIREAYSTITANNLNKVFKLMTSITILMSIFTLVTGVYSMNIALPAAHNPQAFWIILGITSSFIAAAALFFKRHKWF